MSAFGWVTARYAERSLRRNARRTLLSVVGIAVGCALALLTDSLNRGKDEILYRAARSTGLGHLRIAPRGWNLEREPRLRLAGAERSLAAARSTQGVAASVARLRVEALLAMGTHVLGVEVLGVDPAGEPEVDRFARRIRTGRYLSAGERGTMVLGREAARRLRAEVGDEVVASAVAPGGNLQSALFQVVGLADTGSEESDLGYCQIPLDDAAQLSGIPGVGEIALVLREPRRSEEVRRDLAARVAPGDEVLGLEDLATDLHDHLEQDTAITRVMTGLLILVVALGVASAQLAAVLERRREFAVLSAMGMSIPRTVRLLFEEAILLGLAGGAAGLALAYPIVRHFSLYGIDFSKYLGGSYTFSGLVVEPILYCDLGPWMAPEAMGVAVAATIAATLYPAWFAARTDPATALRSAR